MSNYILEMTGITKQFPGVLALNQAEFKLEKGEVHALLGINGAGKSTLIKVMSGINQIDQGVIKFDGREVDLGNTKLAKELGIATVYQSPQMIPSFSGYENVYLGCESERGGFFPYIDRKKLKKRAEEVLSSFPIDIDLSVPVSQLEAVERECVAILRALVQDDISILILDEPTSILSKKEVDVLFELINALKRKGVAIVYITHRLDEVFQICDRYTIFRAGQNVSTHNCSDKSITNNNIAEMMLNQQLAQLYPDHETALGEVVFSIKDLTNIKSFEQINFDVHKKEVVGVFGLVGSGVDELSKALFGALKIDSGEVYLDNKKVTFSSCQEAIKKGIFLVPGNRHREGYIGDETIAFNISLSRLEGISNRGVVSVNKEQQHAYSLIDEFELRPRNANYQVSSLSGGNQQKVVMAKGVYSQSKVYMFSEPTVGVDVGAKALIYKKIRELSKSCSTIVFSTDCEEIYGLCDRVVVLHKGRVVINKRRDQLTLDDMLVAGLTGGEQ